jgi:hypothetical protein
MENEASRTELTGSLLAHVFASSLAAVVGGLLVTNGRSVALMWPPIVVAAVASLVTILPSVIWRNLILHKGIRHLVAIGWRLPMSFASLLLLVCWEGLQRKCFLWALVTCYFVSLTLESWLQIRQANRK